MGGLLAEFGTHPPFWAAAALAAANLAFGWFVLPETLKPDARSRFEWKRANPFGALRFASRPPRLKVPLVVCALYEFAQVAYPAVRAYYAAARFAGRRA